MYSKDNYLISVVGRLKFMWSWGMRTFTDSWDYLTTLSRIECFSTLFACVHKKFKSRVGDLRCVTATFLTANLAAGWYPNDASSQLLPSVTRQKFKISLHSWSITLTRAVSQINTPMKHDVSSFHFCFNIFVSFKTNRDIVFVIQNHISANTTVLEFWGNAYFFVQFLYKRHPTF